MLDSRSIYLRQIILDSIIDAKKGHLGGAFSSIDILRVLYDDILNYDLKNVNWELRDRLIYSKGHGCLALYAILADKGFINKKELKNCFNFDSRLGGHPEPIIPGVEVPTGSLGHGLAIGVGMAIASKILNRKNFVFVILGDGELGEGSIWESALCAAKHKLGNLIAILDYNKFQSSGSVKEILDLEPLNKKWTSFGFEVNEIDGHNVKEIKKNLESYKIHSNKPKILICHTIKGKGIDFAENTAEWHFKRIDEEDRIKLQSSLNNNKI